MNRNRWTNSSGILSLPAGVDPGKLVRAVQASGYPLQTVVARRLSEQFNIVEEWGYVDRVSHDHRTLDIFAQRSLEAKSPRLEPALVLLVECKRSDLPYVFFAAAIPRTPSELPSIFGLARNRFLLYGEPSRHREVPIAHFLRCSDFPFVRSGPVIVSTFSRVERKGKEFKLSGSEPYNALVLPLASALEHYRETWSGVRQHQERYWPTLAICLAVIDAPFVVASGTPEEPDLRTTRWVRLVHQEALREGDGWRRKPYFVDAVCRGVLGEYLDQHIVPFAEQVASRMAEQQDLVLAEEGRVPDWDDWSWGDMRPTSS